MKRAGIITATIIFILFSFYGINITLGALTGKDIRNLEYFIGSNDNAALFESDQYCSVKSRIPGLEQSKDPELLALYKFEEACQSFASDSMMFFTTMPNSIGNAQDLARSMSNKLREFSKYNVKPLVIIEPETQWGLIDFTEFGQGFYDPWIEEYFKSLLQLGITDEIMGTWVPFPEANLPYWNRSNSTPEDFGIIVNKYLTILRKYFPNTKTSILLNSATYESDDFDWANGDYLSLIPYVEKIEPGLIDSFGLQGFPWSGHQGSRSRNIMDPAEYLNYKLAVEAAEKLGVKKIWFNTGSFAAKYTNDPDSVIYIDANTRKGQLLSVIEEANKLVNLGYEVSVNIFAEDKSATQEATNWSYHDSESSLVLIDFLNKAEQNNLNVSFYDKVVEE